MLTIMKYLAVDLIVLSEPNVRIKRRLTMLLSSPAKGQRPGTIENHSQFPKVLQNTPLSGGEGAGCPSQKLHPPFRPLLSQPPRRNAP